MAAIPSRPGDGTGHDPLTPTVGWGVLHLFFRVGPAVDDRGGAAAVKDARAGGDQVVTVALLGHKADLA